MPFGAKKPMFVYSQSEHINIRGGISETACHTKILEFFQPLKK